MGEVFGFVGACDRGGMLVNARGGGVGERRARSTAS